AGNPASPHARPAPALARAAGARGAPTPPAPGQGGGGGAAVAPPREGPPRARREPPGPADAECPGHVGGGVEHGDHAATAFRIRSRRSAAVTSEPMASTANSAVTHPVAAMRIRMRQRSVLPTGPPCTRCAPDATPANATHDGA